ncbi:NUDIX hydrolase [Tunicatimonas pelagia]|uniref:NUDIX hydrolase n=1 Tax=Tunicatimonas pelagia TaxID=931531 RepID=UPI00266528CF|nr:NUDIX domain-containing protein [Tunicatimonas pelagia]WKN42955.1 NUDIX domain-containing protein [Tunicatimonas pelagia]
MNNLTPPAPIIDKLAWILLRDQKILMARSHNKDTFYIPGGKREVGESDAQALTREIKEELNVTLVPASLKLVGTFQAQAHGQPKGVEVRMTCYTADYQGTLEAAAEIAEIEWFTHAQLPEVGPVDQIIFSWLYERELIAN